MAQAGWEWELREDRDCHLSAFCFLFGFEFTPSKVQNQALALGSGTTTGELREPCVVPGSRLGSAGCRQGIEPGSARLGGTLISLLTLISGVSTAADTRGPGTELRHGGVP